jgi:hypothetical protein
MFVACQKSKVTIKLRFYYSNLKNAVETAKSRQLLRSTAIFNAIAVD